MAPKASYIPPMDPRTAVNGETVFEQLGDSTSVVPQKRKRGRPRKPREGDSQMLPASKGTTNRAGLQGKRARPNSNAVSQSRASTNRNTRQSLGPTLNANGPSNDDLVPHGSSVPDPQPASDNNPLQREATSFDPYRVPNIAPPGTVNMRDLERYPEIHMNPYIGYDVNQGNHTSRDALLEQLSNHPCNGELPPPPSFFENEYDRTMFSRAYDPTTLPARGIANAYDPYSSQEIQMPLDASSFRQQPNTAMPPYSSSALRYGDVAMPPHSSSALRYGDVAMPSLYADAYANIIPSHTAGRFASPSNATAILGQLMEASESVPQPGRTEDQYHLAQWRRANRAAFDLTVRPAWLDLKRPDTEQEERQRVAGGSGARYGPGRN
ncbi:MAG: hypothetical protein Q9227_000201 [Pyrenula ochraceoflavens]